ncbi:hypothetical protein CHS0354_042646 [Potamilus streckersoni]|uniref:Uncharacterized protein n=1 Tax=Potamilus streckersoni TaxID=2493646 RepID=A0AAE0TET6_9BIVA|nr:hypothetical protein CHS0354_042646 [Potamilus streckersoni]
MIRRSTPGGEGAYKKESNKRNVTSRREVFRVSVEIEVWLAAERSLHIVEYRSATIIATEIDSRDSVTFLSDWKFKIVLIENESDQ